MIVMLCTLLSVEQRYLRTGRAAILRASKQVIRPKATCLLECVPACLRLRRQLGTHTHTRVTAASDRAARTARRTSVRRGVSITIARTRCH